MRFFPAILPVLLTLPAFAQQYKVEVVDPGGGFDLFHPFDLNEEGVAVGFVFDGTGTQLPWKWSLDGGGEALPFGSQFTGGTATGMNADGVIVGTMSMSPGESRAVIWDGPGEAQLLQDVMGTSHTLLSAGGINNSGFMAGVARVDGHEKIWILRNGTLHIISDALVWPSVRDVTNDGKVVGTNGHMFIWQDGSFDYPDASSHHPYSSAADANDAGQVVGWAVWISQAYEGATYWEDGEAIQVANRSHLTSINEIGDMVGAAEVHNQGWHPIGLRNGSFVELEDQLVSNPGWDLNFALLIDEAGGVLGHGEFQGENRTYYLRPVCGSCVSYCGPAAVNSTGNSATLEAGGWESLSYDALTLHLADAPANEFAAMIATSQAGTIPFGAGQLCLDGTSGGYLRLALGGTDGNGQFDPAISLPAGATPGSTWFFQSVFRDGSTHNTSNGVEITFLP